MKLYNKHFASSYDELITYYPRFYHDVYEMTEILKAHGRIADELEANIEQTFLNAFADYADAKTLTKLEEFFRINHDESASLASRRTMIKAILLGQNHAGQKEIEELLSIFTDGEIDMELIDGTLRITVTRDFGDNFNLHDCYFILGRLIPAHLALGMIDKALPIAVFTENRFVFNNLKTSLSVRNRTASVDGIMLDGGKMLDGTWKLNSTYPGIPFINFRAAAILPKNGNACLSKKFDFSAYRLPNALGLSVRQKFGLDARSQFAVRSTDFRAKVLFRNYDPQFQGAAETEIFGGAAPRKLGISGFAIHNSLKATTGTQFAVGVKQQGNFRQEASAVAGLSAKQPLGFSGSVVMDGRWALNGDFILDGSRSLNQIFLKEDL